MMQLGVVGWLAEACRSMGVSKPTPVQCATIPEILAGRQVIACAETGSGKTAAFAVPILQMLSVDPYGIFAVVLTPTRELAVQIAEQFRAFGRPLRTRIATIIGGTDLVKQAMLLSKKPHIVIATPGRLAAHIRNESTADLSRCKFLVIDEADRLLDGKFESDLSEIIDSMPKTHKTLLFSATMSSSLKQLKDLHMADAFEWSADAKPTTVARLKEHYIFTPPLIKECYLIHLIQNSTAPSLIVFASTKRTCQLLVLILKRLEIETVGLHADLKQVQRLAALRMFRARKAKVLVATDVASRGLDIPTVELVINYDFSRDPTDYIHRVGRTARAGRGGCAISLTTPYDVSLLKQVEKNTGKKLEAYDIKEDDVLPLMNNVSAAKRAAKLRMAEIESRKLEKSAYETVQEAREVRNRSNKRHIPEPVAEDKEVSNKKGRNK